MFCEAVCAVSYMLSLSPRWYYELWLTGAFLFCNTCFIQHLFFLSVFDSFSVLFPLFFQFSILKESDGLEHDVIISFDRLRFVCHESFLAVLASFCISKDH